MSYIGYRLIGVHELSALRSLNHVLNCGVAVIASAILREASRDARDQDRDSIKALRIAHSALNIALFPPLFFFSALYYTDVASTFFVLLNYWLYVQSRQRNGSTSWPAVSAFVTGAIALLFRQTNVFWVVVLPAGLVAVDSLKSTWKKPSRTPSDQKKSIQDILRESCVDSVVYDPPLSEASMTGTLYDIPDITNGLISK